MKIGFIGCGNMGGALISGILKKKLYTPDSILVYDVDRERQAAVARKRKVVPAQSIKELIRECGILVVAVKPQDVEGLLKEDKELLDVPGKIVISIAAGLHTSLYRKYLSKALIARVMPNMPAMVGKGASGIFLDGSFGDADKKAVLDIFKACGIAEVIKKEELLDVVTGLSGSGPAFVFTFINSLADAGVMEGLPRDVSIRLAIQTVLGSAELAASDGAHLEELKDRVMSPGGTTAAGIFELEQGGFRAAVMRGVKGALRRSRELGGK